MPVPLLVLAALALPAPAAAHGRVAIVALDYRLRLDPATLALPGVQVRVLDGDRDLQVRVAPGVRLLVRGALHEPMLRIGPGGIWINARSPTATLDGLVSAARHSWVRVSRGRSIAWHDRRLLPPPGTRPGPAGRFEIAVDVNGKAAAIEGTFIRVARPSPWPWAAGAVALAAGIVLARRRLARRTWLAPALGAVAGVTALVEVSMFALRDSSTGGGAWLQAGASAALALALATALLRRGGRGRVRAAGAVGAVAAAVSLGSLPVFWHGVIVSALPAVAVRAGCGLALVCGLAAAALGLLPTVTGPARSRPAPLRPARR